MVRITYRTPSEIFADWLRFQLKTGGLVKKEDVFAFRNTLNDEQLIEVLLSCVNGVNDGSF